VITCTLQGIARVWSGQAAAWPLVSDQRGHRGSKVKNRREKNLCQGVFSWWDKIFSVWAVLEVGGVPPDTQRAIPGINPLIEGF
jgi:hypothetical protein